MKWKASAPYFAFIGALWLISDRARGVKPLAQPYVEWQIMSHLYYASMMVIGDRLIARNGICPLDIHCKVTCGMIVPTSYAENYINPNQLS